MQLGPKIIKPELVSNVLPKIGTNSDIDTILKKRFFWVTGLAGSGKTTLIKNRIIEKPEEMELAATTGIAAINLGTRTINSILKYFDTRSLRNAYIDSFLQLNLRKVRERREKLIIDEASMMDAEALDIIFDAVSEINNDANPRKLGIGLVADLLQLPPIKAKYIFEANCWNNFAENTIRLTKIWRQDNKEFIEALNLVRSGEGKSAVNLLQDCGVEFKNEVDKYFNGTTIIPKNADVNDFNSKRLAELNGNMIRVVPLRKGEPASEWKPERDLIPVEQRFKISCLVMILSNDTEKWEYANGDTGIITNYEAKKDVFTVKLERNGNEVEIPRILRLNLTDKAPTNRHFQPNFQPYVDHLTSQWVIGTIYYHPLRIAYASTAHKVQGLTLDNVQIDGRHQFFGAPSMFYVAMSRARTPEGLVIVGTPELIARRINIDPKVKEFI